MLLNLGLQLRRLQLEDVRHAVVSVCIRIGGGVAAAAAFVAVLGVGGVERQVLLLAGGLPAAVMNVVLAQRYDASPTPVASAIVLSTLASLVSIPAILLWVT
jgi:predicted permease